MFRHHHELHLSCDHPACDPGVGQLLPQLTLYGASLTECRAKARTKGWRIRHRPRARVYCPEHAGTVHPETAPKA